MPLPYQLSGRYAWWWILSTCFGICGWFLADNVTTTSRATTKTTRLAQYGWPCPVQATGSTATVFRCLMENGTMYAVKRFRKPGPGVSATAYADSVHHEVRVGAQIPPHRQILEILDFFAEDGRWYLVMPFVPTSLYDHTVGDGAHGYSVDEVDCVFYQLLNGVAFLHQWRVTHLDLKLNNILITEDGEVKIIDLGQARFFDRSVPEPKLTRPLGTPPNFPWEAYHDQAYDPFAADAWALGIIYCESILPTAPWNLGTQGNVEKEQFAFFGPTDTPDGKSQSTTPMEREQVKSTVEMILGHLPPSSRPLISQLLNADPAKRIGAIERASSDLWFSSLRRRCSSQS
ncbi:checkpoint kinase [Aspergillus flavus]|uniref:Checkpoint kinase n=2 Tax=Aspergillus subgen. Circumdati TaxID=2720871 RepID=A0A5N6GZI4_ASPFL|nr:checkpoint kinase [Aspergillus oryzae 3.042]KAB8247355.1 checkpoint kinase [Aspergillus flavus]GMF70489.1 unnamed protein product [Aspergillus oryzae]|eukprot:EIT83534.1 checkpoint kinase [Aspergillus oryzae 3.042]